MMRLELQFNKITPMSINKAYYQHRKVLTAAARDYRKALWEQLEPHSKKIKAFEKAFDKLKHSLHLDLTISVPSERFKTKQGYIGRHSIDIDNCIKLLNDFVLNKRFQAEKYGASTVGIDDQFITKIVAEKRDAHSDNWNINFNLHIVELD